MSTVIEINGKKENVCDNDDFYFLVEEHMGDDAAAYLQELLEKIEELEFANRELEYDVRDLTETLVGSKQGRGW